MTKSLLFALLLFAIPAQAQCLDRTGWNATLIVTDAPEGKITATHEDTCIGEGTFEGEPMAMALWQRDMMEPDGPGPSPGDPFVIATDEGTQDFTYEQNGIYVVELHTSRQDTLEADLLEIEARYDSLLARTIFLEAKANENADKLARLDSLEVTMQVVVDFVRRMQAK